jgi:hypothetical protein
MSPTDRLATYDSEAIGREFNSAPIDVEIERRRHETRRLELARQEMKEAFGDSRAIPKSSLKQVCKFETQKVCSESLITWVLTIVLSALAGTICAIVIKHLNM